MVEACEEPSEVKYLYPLTMPLRERVEVIAREVYGADGVDWAPLALLKAERFEQDRMAERGFCVRWRGRLR